MVSDPKKEKLLAREKLPSKERLVTRFAASEDESPKSQGWRDSLKSLKADSLAVLLGPAVSLPFAACYAALVCRLPELQPYFPIVLQQVMWTQFAGSVLSLFLGQFVTTTNLDPLVSILFNQLARRMQLHFLGSAADLLLPNMMLMMPIITMLLGFALYAIGRWRLAFMLRFFPYTVVGGFLAGSGMLILLESLALAAGEEIWSLSLRTAELVKPDLSLYMSPAPGDHPEIMGAWAQVALAMVFALAVAKARDAYAFGTPALLVACVVISFLVQGVTGGAYPPRSWFLEFPEPVSWWRPFEELGASLTGEFIPTRAVDLEFAATFVTIMAVSWSINTLAIAKLVPLRPGIRRCDEQAEIQSLGLTNIILGGLGCHAAMQSFKIPMIMKEVNAGTLWPLFNVGVNFVLFIYSPRTIVNAVPRFLFAGSVVRLSCDLISEWLIESRTRIALNEWRILALTAVVVVVNVTLGILFGLFLTLVLFAVEYSGVTGVIRSGTLRDVHSTVERSADEQHLLWQYADYVHVLWLSGYLFFGSATQVADEVRAAVANPAVKVVVLDFSLVPAMDASGVWALVELAHEIIEGPQKNRLVLCGLVRRLENALQNAAKHHGTSDLALVHDLDGALELCENELLEVLARKGLKIHRATSGLPKIDSLGTIAGAMVEEDNDGAVSPDIWPQLLAQEIDELDADHIPAVLDKLSGAPRPVASGEVLFRHGEPAHALIVLLGGALEVTRPREACAVPDGLRHHLPRHHLNDKKGDVYVFEEAHPCRVRRARRGAVFGAVEYAASGGLLNPAAAGPASSTTSTSPEGVAVSIKVPVSTAQFAEQYWAPFQCTGTAVGTAEVLEIPFEKLKEAEVEEPKLALVLRTWLARLSATALLGPRAQPRLLIPGLTTSSSTGPGAGKALPATPSNTPANAA